MISFHLNTRDFHLHYLYTHFTTGDDKGQPSYVANAITRCVTSPIIWKGGLRRASEFQYVDWMVLDIDDGMTLEESIEKFGKYRHVIGTTRSHRKVKGTQGPRDRFRVWIKLRERCEDLKQFSYNVKVLAEECSGDRQAIDGARKFLPCVKIASLGDGILLDLKNPPAPPPVITVDQSYTRFIPGFIRDMLEGTEVLEGGRNYACYTIGKYLSRNGFSENEIVEMIMRSPVPESVGKTREVRAAVKSGSKGR